VSQAQHEYEVMRELEELEHAATIKAIDDALYQRSIATKWPSVLLWPGKQVKRSAVTCDDGIEKEANHGFRS
jgi:hypothetical protein